MKYALPAMLALMLAACAPLPAEKPSDSRSRMQTPAPASEQDSAPLPHEIPPNLEKLPDAVPQAEPRSRYGNPPSYEVFGKRYHVLPTAEGYRERGHASWYGRKFQGRRTSSGEPYDMFAMTAAHKTLPLPSYVRVTNLKNGRSIVVKVNDRGPFHPGRIIDLSYTAALKLDILKHGAAPVEVEALTPGQAAATKTAAPPAVLPAPPVSAPVPPKAATSTAKLGYWQVAVYGDAINAAALRADLHNAGIGPVELWAETGGAGHRVVVGPYPDPLSGEGVRQQLLGRGLNADWVLR